LRGEAMQPVHAANLVIDGNNNISPGMCARLLCIGTEGIARLDILPLRRHPTGDIFSARAAEKGGDAAICEEALCGCGKGQGIVCGQEDGVSVIKGIGMEGHIR
jgi:hypothetical protein